MIGDRIILVTGAAGFIGSSLINELLKDENIVVVGIDNLNRYYDIHTKLENIKRNKNDRFAMLHYDITDKHLMEKLFNEWNITEVYHLAAQAGVRYSIEHPSEVIQTNIQGFQNIIENCINHNINKIVYASSSSVYGNLTDNDDIESESTDNQMSPYAVTKKCNELMAQMYSNIYPQLKLSGLRLFTVYGPYMRPDLAISKFTKAILNDEPIEIYGDGNKERDFTYIDDVVRIMIKIMNSDKSWHHEIFNIGYGNSITINELVNTIINNINKDYNKIIYKENATGDVDKTYASNQKIKEWFDDYPKVDIYDGIIQYIEWYKKNGEL
jgi:UDP-glucuronate 4-epimerase